MIGHEWDITTESSEMLDGTSEWGARLVCTCGYQAIVAAQYASEAGAVTAVERMAKWSSGHGIAS